jgi:hypothetical protein
MERKEIRGRSESEASSSDVPDFRRADCEGTSAATCSSLPRAHHWPVHKPECS